MMTARRLRSRQRRLRKAWLRSAAAVGARDELPQALVILAAGGTTLEVSAHAGQTGIGVLAGQLEIDVLVEKLEALLTADLRAGRSEHAGDQVAVGVVCAHAPPPVWSWSG